PTVTLIANDRNRGFAAANNQAYAASRGRLVLLLNSDTLVNPGQIEALAAFLEATPDAGVVGPKLLNADGSFQLSACPFVRPWDVYFEHARFPRPLQPEAQRSPRRLYRFPETDAMPVDYVIGAALMIRREVVEAIGLLDEGFFMYGEEQDWCYRAKAAGWGVYYLPTAVITHLGGASAELAPHPMLAARFASSFRLLGKHQGLRAVLLTRVLLAIAAAQNCLLLLARRLSGREAPDAFFRQWCANGIVLATALRGRA
ncbi:MAG TPA: glycosyltransferase, partial [Oscillatoriaceae cyanobacterium]